jgi:peptide/nickel transport system substrate-binding protein
VRQAIAAAINPDTIDQRENEGAGIPTTALFHETFPWDPGVAGPEYDLERAKELVAQAKSEGWDGKVRLQCDNAPSAQARALAIKTMLEAAGIELSVTNDSDVSGTIGAVIMRKDYDLACWGLSVPGDDGAVFQAGYFFVSNGAANRTGYKNPEMDAALKDLRAASNDDERQAAF